VQLVEHKRNTNTRASSLNQDRQNPRQIYRCARDPLAGLIHKHSPSFERCGTRATRGEWLCPLDWHQTSFDAG
jgi:hypothetical protein